MSMSSNEENILDDSEDESFITLQKPRKVAPLYDSDSEADISDTELTGDDSDNNVIEESFESTHVVRDSFGGSIAQGSGDEDSNYAISVKSDDEELNNTSSEELNVKKVEEAAISSDEQSLIVAPISSQVITVSQEEYDIQSAKLASIQSDLLRVKNAMRITNLDNLSDKGKSLIDKVKSYEKSLENERQTLQTMVPRVEPLGPNNAFNKVQVAWDDVHLGINSVQPRTLGKTGIEKYETEKQLTLESLDSLHKSLDSRPGENDVVDDPKGIKTPLMEHQKKALAWLLWREKHSPSSGILADDMGLGKTFTMICFILKSAERSEDVEDESEDCEQKYKGGTLVVCPASLINQWSGEVEKRVKRGYLNVEVHHGIKRETRPKTLAQHDIVITTYATALSESERRGTIFKIYWKHIILDEAHQIRNHKSRTAEAIFKLPGRSRWALTGTPVHNKIRDMYSLMKFLKCSPFDNFTIFKHWTENSNSGGSQRLHALVSSLMLRRTKAELISIGSLESMPERKWELIRIALDKDEMAVYQKILIFSRTLFGQFLHQRALKNQEYHDTNVLPGSQNGEYMKVRDKLLRLNNGKDIKQHEILVLILRLRQICCHPSLITEMLSDAEDLENIGDDGESQEISLLEQLSKLDINEDKNYEVPSTSEERVGLKEASSQLLNSNHPVFDKERASSKIKAVIHLLSEKISGDDKAIIVSQWTSLLKLMTVHLRNEGIKYSSLDGTVKVDKRMEIVDNFNDPNSDNRVMLLSLTAGGVGLNLVGANHLFLLDLHWNPQLENQAQDRIYRVGQKKPVFVYKFMAIDTIEERIKSLQDSKLEIADGVLTGSKKMSSSKLTLQDLKLIFSFN